MRPLNRKVGIAHPADRHWWAVPDLLALTSDFLPCDNFGL